jgi:hypothetical protein
MRKTFEIIGNSGENRGKEVYVDGYVGLPGGSILAICIDINTGFVFTVPLHHLKVRSIII